MSEDLQRARAAAAAAAAEIMAEINQAGGLDEYEKANGGGPRKEWDLTRDYRGTIDGVTVKIPDSGAPRFQLIVSATEPAEYKGNKAWLTFFLSEKAIPYTLRDLVPLLLAHGISSSEMDLFDEAKSAQQFTGKNVIFSLKPGNKPEFPERRWLNRDTGQALKTDHPLDPQGKLRESAEAAQPFPEEAEVAVAAPAPVEAPAVTETVVSAPDAAVVITDVQPVEEVAPAPVAEVAPAAAPAAPANTGVSLPPGLG